MRVFVEGVGLLGPGLRGWEAARRVLTGEEPFCSASTVIGTSDLLPPAERRRTPVPVKLALAVGHCLAKCIQALVHPAVVPRHQLAVFARDHREPRDRCRRSALIVAELLLQAFRVKKRGALGRPESH